MSQIPKSTDPSVANLWAILQKIPESFIVFEAETGRILDANDSCCRMSGYGREELQQLFIKDFGIGHGAAMSSAREKEAVAEGSVTYPAVFRSKDGSVCEVEATLSPLNPEGSRFVHFFRDMTPQKQIEQALRESERDLRRAQGMAQVGSWRFNLDTGIVLATEETRRIYGLDGSQWSIQQVQKIPLPQYRSALDAALKKLLEGTLPYDVEFEIRRPTDDSIRFIHSVAEYDREQNTIFGTIQDITEQKKLRDTLQRISRLESLGILAGGIAHDFNNLLGGIYGYIDMANEVSKSDSVSAYLGKALNTMDRARDLTHQMLTFAKGGVPVKEPQDIVPFVEETAAFALSGSNVSLKCVWPADLRPCAFDRNQVAQVVENLVINAKQAMAEGGELIISGENVDLDTPKWTTLSPGAYVHLSISDSGTGIERESLDRIFDPFFTTKKLGHGLGLATCHSIIQRHEGHIEVESEPGKGTTFHIYLPASMETPCRENADETHTATGSGRILVMDDEEVMREAIADMLHSLGYEAICVANGKDALDRVIKEIKAGRSLVAMIFDLTIPGAMGGKQTLDSLRELHVDIPAFVASGYSEDPVMARPQEFGFTASLSKPFRRSELAQMLAKALGT